MKRTHIPHFLVILLFVVSFLLFPTVAHALAIDPRGNLDFTFTGAVNGPLVAKDIKICGHNQDLPYYAIQMHGSINRAPYFFSLTITSYSGPGSYTALIALDDTKGGFWTNRGSVTIAGSEVSGTVSATALYAQASSNINTPVQVSGRWWCPVLGRGGA